MRNDILMQERIDYKKLNFQLAKEILGGKNVVFTGRGFLVRGELMRLARQAGANVDSVVTKKCDILIVGEKPGSKLRKAKVLGCDIITISDFRDILEGKIKKEQIEIDDTLNIDLGNEEVMGINILRKNIKLLISNDAARERIIRSIKLNGGSIVNNIDESIDILVYQPNSEINEILKLARSLNIEVFTLGEFNKRLIINK
ncbi:BRCT domain-containing protein [uncultured Clostridium sp.]|uniref:BRCT domain-containing protein n=1 Tax=uncultured Clostridium sp. TaxID=59620 RepID=UPI0025ED3AB0|nr:BRCT domain-containing protein [uncultured Clostridium sp.]MDU7078363.1 BRCT domain-containing protein [Clostridium celatum]